MASEQRPTDFVMQKQSPRIEVDGIASSSEALTRPSDPVGKEKTSEVS